jgi:fermentation-respiration switch protein FrsA (DUF1100 family)
MHQAFMLSSMLVVLFAAEGQTLSPGKNKFTLRGKEQDLYFLPAKTAGQRPIGKILYAPGDGGWRGFAITQAKTMAGWGYDVYGIDTKRYLESFTGKTNLTVSDVMADFHTLAESVDKDGQVCLVGWSEGAGLELLAAAAEGNKKAFSGLVVIGLAEASLLGWRTADDLTYITKREPNEPHFPSAPYLPKISPLPFVMIHSDHDDYTSVDAAKKMFAEAREPKRFWLISARSHRFDGGTETFFRALRDGLEWIVKSTR